MAEAAQLVFATFPDLETARRIVRSLVEEHLAACGNLIPAVESIYRWQGAIEHGNEVIAILKTENHRYEALERRLKELHPYDVPECITVKIVDGLPEYLRWLTESVVPPRAKAVS